MSQTTHRLLFALGFTSILLGTVAFAPADKPVPAGQDKIRQALDGQDPRQTGDGVLDDVLKVIKQRGSVLRGSVLDGSVGNDLETDSAGSDFRAAKNAIVAEQLLRASRLLESLQTPDPTRRRLIGQMRGEAVKLLSE